MKRKEIILAALAAGDRAAHEPVHMQKILFVLDREIPNDIRGPCFNFQPRDYGPFDVVVYNDLDELEKAGLVEITFVRNTQSRLYRVTSKGQQQGEETLGKLSLPVADYIKRLSKWVRDQSFTGLVSEIYRKYPDMKVNSVFADS